MFGLLKMVDHVETELEEFMAPEVVYDDVEDDEEDEEAFGVRRCGVGEEPHEFLRLSSFYFW